MSGSPGAVVIDDGLVSTAIWYYVNRRKGGGPPLNASLQEAQGTPLSNRRGIRWAALAQANVPPINVTGALGAAEWDDWMTEDPAKFSEVQFLGIKALFLTTFGRPVPVALLDGSSSSSDRETDPAYVLAIAYRTVGNNLDISVPDQPGVSFRATFTPQGMTPFTVTSVNGTPFNVKAVAGLHYVNVVHDPKLAAQWTRVADGTIGNAEGWPTPKLVWEKGELDTAAVYLLDPLQHWWECSACPDIVPPPSGLPSTASHVQRTKYASFTGTTIGPLLGPVASFNLSKDLIPEPETSRRAGNAVLHPYAADAQLGVASGWLDWITVTYKKLKLTPSVAVVDFSKDTTINITVTASPAPPTGLRYRWKFRNGATVDSVETTTAAHSRDLKAGDAGWLIFSALQSNEKRPIARDSIEIKSTAPGPFWKIVTISNPDSLHIEPDPAEPVELFDILYRLVNAPGSGAITIEQNGGVREFRLRVLKSSFWNPATCCPLPPHNPATEWLQLLGQTPPVPFTVGPFFAGWTSTSFSQSTEALDSGTMTGQYMHSTILYDIKDVGQQMGPTSGLRTTATRNGTTLTGVISLHAWGVNSESGQIEDGVEISRFPFTAVRMK